MRKLVLCALAAVCVASAAEFAGKWKGSVNRSEGNSPASVYLELRKQGDSISGDIGYNPDETSPISNVKVDGDKLSFEVSTSSALYKVDLAAAEDTLSGNVVVNRDGQVSQPVKLQLSRQK
jgi:hypothetical protein